MLRNLVDRCLWQAGLCRTWKINKIFHISEVKKSEFQCAVPEINTDVICWKKNENFCQPNERNCVIIRTTYSLKSSFTVVILTIQNRMHTSEKYLLLIVLPLGRMNVALKYGVTHFRAYNNHILRAVKVIFQRAWSSNQRAQRGIEENVIFLITNYQWLEQERMPAKHSELSKLGYNAPVIVDFTWQ